MMPSQFVAPVAQVMSCRRVSLKKSLVMLLCLLLFNLSLGCLQSWASALMLTDRDCHSMQLNSVTVAADAQSHAQLHNQSAHQPDIPSPDLHDMQHHCLASCSLFLQAPQLQPLSELRFSLQPTAQSCAHLATPLQGCLSNPERPPQLIS